MSRRLLGYVVKLADGTRSEHTRRPVSLAYASAHLCDDGAVIPVFSKPKPAVVVPPLAQALAILSIDKTKPAPAVAAEGLFAVLVQHEGHKPTTFLDLDMAVTVAPFREVGTRAEVLAAVENETPAFRRMAVRILPDGAHEAAIAAAREEGRREAFAVARGVVESEVVHVRTREYMVKKLDEAAKGAAK